MKKPDYKKLGFKCGIEIHQQLEGRKLFCSCPTEIRKAEPDFRLFRRLRASAGEQGRVDQAALHEQQKQKHFVYHGYNDINCLVEADEEPPHPVNQEALSAALQAAKMLNCRVVDKIQVMRKTVIDGSNTSGFQRTMLVGMDGFIEVDGRKIRIETVCLEEEACQVIERKKEYDVYNLSRLGIPLIEIATAPDITTPEQARETAAKLGMILRSTGRCKRGIGSIRQDVNLSIKNTARVEIKGFQELKSIPRVIAYEAGRRLKLIEKGKKPEKEVRKAEPDMTTSYLRPMPGMDRMYPETDIPQIVPELAGIKKVKTIEQKVNEISKQFNISKALASELVKKDVDLAGYVKKYKNLKPLFIAETLINKPKEIKSRFGREIDVFKHADKVLSKADQGEIPRSAVFEILSELAQGKKPDFSRYSSISADQLEKEVKELVKKHPDAPVNGLMGTIMSRHRGRVNGKQVIELLKKHMKK